MCKNHQEPGFLQLHPKLAEILAEHNIKSPADCETSEICNEKSLFLEADEEVFLSDEIIDEINSSQNHWKAGKSKFHGMKRKDIKRMMGAIIDEDWHIRIPAKEEPTVTNFPESFDSAEEWPQCADLINAVRDQSNCGSCWAFGTADPFNDRRCISGKGDAREWISDADVTGCCGLLSCLSMGCNGGQVSTPWGWFKNNGVVTGGEYGDNLWCYPYTMPECAHHVDPEPHRPVCADVAQVAPQCSKTCESGNGADYDSDKKYATDNYALSTIDSIKNDLVKFGPVTAAFYVYDCFLSYREGVYTKTSSSILPLGGHAVTIVGWGTENGLDYWRCRNSWNDGWGDNGHFKIAMDSCGITDRVYAGQA